MIMGVTVSVVLMLLPLGFFYKYMYDKYGVDYAYALHFSTNMTVLLISIVSSMWARLQYILLLCDLYPQSLFFAA